MYKKNWFWMGITSVIFFIGLHVIDAVAETMQQIEVSLKPPTQNVDGSPIEPAEIESYEVCIQQPEAVDCNYRFSSTKTRFLIDMPIPDGTYTIKARASSIYGVTSDWSNKLEVVLDNSKPGITPPSNLEIKIIISIGSNGV